MGTMKVLSLEGQQPNSGNALWKLECEVCGYTTVTSWKHNVKSGCKSCHGRVQQKRTKYKRDKEGDLYMFRTGPYVKIGTSKDVMHRLAAIQSATPYEVELVGLWKGEASREEEWHKALEHCHVRGEWFKLGGACEI